MPKGGCCILELAFHYYDGYYEGANLKSYFTKRMPSRTIGQIYVVMANALNYHSKSIIFPPYFNP